MMKLQVGTSCYGGLVTVGYMTSLMKLMQFSLSNGFEVSTDIIGGDSLITRLRNTLISRFLHAPDATHFMFIDADMAFEPAQVHRMLTFDEDVVAGMYARKAMRWDAPDDVTRNEPPETAMLQYTGLLCEGDEYQRRGPFATARHCGAGFMMVKRHVVERLVEAHPEAAYDSDHVYVTNRANHRYHALFDCMIDPDTREYLSDDLAFCHRWRALGGTIWLDVEGSLVHTGPHRFVGQPAIRFGTAVKRRLEAEPK
jgi:hypothetical protein